MRDAEGAFGEEGLVAGGGGGGVGAGEAATAGGETGGEGGSCIEGLAGDGGVFGTC